MEVSHSRRGVPPFGAPASSWHVPALERSARRWHVQDALLVTKRPAGQPRGRRGATQALSQHVSQFRGARRTGVHYLRKNMRAPDRPLLYLRGT